MRLGAFTKLGKFGGGTDERNLSPESESEPAIIQVEPKRIWLNVANNFKKEVNVKTRDGLEWKAF